MKEHKKANRSQTKRVASLLIAVIAVALIILAVLTMGDFLFGSASQDTTITLTGEENGAEVAQILEDNGLIKYKLAFQLLTALSGRGDQFQAGSYELKAGSGYVTILSSLTAQEPYRTVDVTISEGYTVKQIGQVLSEQGVLDEQDFTDALNGEYDYDFLPPADKENRLEGYLFPDTYNFSNQSSASTIIKTMLNRFGQIFTDDDRKRAAELDMSIDEVITLASMIEAEAGSDEDRALVSSVFHNRLQSSQYPYLESCATVQYILGVRKPILSNEDIQIDSPYNTYINPGLPAGAICNPGRASIEAALYPADTDYYFFQSDADGNMFYARTLDEHERMRRQIQN